MCFWSGCLPLQGCPGHDDRQFIFVAVFPYGSIKSRCDLIWASKTAHQVTLSTGLKVRVQNKKRVSSRSRSRFAQVTTLGGRQPDFEQHSGFDDVQLVYVPPFVTPASKSTHVAPRNLASGLLEGIQVALTVQFLGAIVVILASPSRYLGFCEVCPILRFAQF